MSQQLITTSNADRNLAAGATVLSATPDASNPRLCYALILLGDGTKNLSGDGGDFAVTITIAGNTYGGGAEAYELGLAPRAAIQTTAFFVPAGAAVTIAIDSPNAADTDVDCTAYLVSEDGPTAAAVSTIDDFLDTEIAAIKAKTDLIGTGLIVLPVTGTVVGRGVGTALVAFTNELVAFTVAVTDSTGEGVDLSAMTLEMVFESGATDVTILNAAITKADGSFGFTTTSALTTAERLWKWALRKTDETVILTGTLEVIYAANN